MELTVIEAKTIDDAFYQALNACVNDGYEYTIDRGSYAGTKRKELDHVTIRIEYPGTRPLLPILPEGMAAPWDEEYVYSYLDKLMTTIRPENTQYTYGERLNYVKGKSSAMLAPGVEVPISSGESAFEVTTKMLKETPETNQACNEIGQPTDVWLNDPPCLRLLDKRVRYGKLHYITYWRSWDLWGALPANLSALQLMKELESELLGVNDGEIIATSKGLHIYQYAFELAKARLGKK